MRKFGLIGNPLEHSFSPDYFRNKFEKEGIDDAEYKAYPLQKPDDIFKIIERDTRGLNVTSPFKQSIIPFLDELDDNAASIMAVNTIDIRDGILKGYNTDIYGFIQSIGQELDTSIKRQALILGTGGAAQAVSFALGTLGWKSVNVSRAEGGLNYSNLTPGIIMDHTFIVNATPLGMGAHINAFPQIPFEGIGPDHIVMDLIYNPEKTVFLKRAENRGARILNGYSMLVFQAEKSWEIWNQ